MEVKLAFDGKGRDDFHKMLEEALQRKGWEVMRPATAPTAPRAPTLGGCLQAFVAESKGVGMGSGFAAHKTRVANEEKKASRTLQAPTHRLLPDSSLFKRCFAAHLINAL